MSQREPLSAAQRQSLIDKIRALPGQIEVLVGTLTDAQLCAQFLPGEWTVAQNVHHLADTHMHDYLRLKLILIEERSTFPPFSQNPWAELPDAVQLPIEPSLLLLKGLHQRMADAFAHVQGDAWQRVGLHARRGPMTVEDLLVLTAEHGDTHIDQITRTLAAGQG
jgi:hypothetical protein